MDIPTPGHSKSNATVELIYVVVAITAIAWLLSIPARRYEKRTGKKLGRSGAAGMMNVLNELYLPSAANAAIIVEEQRERRVAIPSPEDKDFERNQITINLPKE